VEHYHHASAARLGHAPYTPVFYAALGTAIVRARQALAHAARKVVVLDCDMTLWKGVCGEDGPGGVEIDAPRAALQRFMVERHDAGMLLCLCSKNDEADVLETFARH
jgi:predicted enzyme involved in methoxymalonyl-ACP biosynthesis